MARQGDQTDLFIHRFLQPQWLKLMGRLTVGFTLTLIGAMIATDEGGRTKLGPPLGGDYVFPYAAGWIYNHVGVSGIYDLAEYNRHFRALFPHFEQGDQLGFINTPFLLAPAALLARLPYAWSFLLWVIIAFALYYAGFKLLWQTFEALPKLDEQAALWAVLGFAPLCVESIAGGQTTVIGFFALAAAISLERRGRWLVSGLALSLCCYKVTFCLLILPMLLLTKRWRTLAGFALGGAFFALLTLLVAGWQGCLAYVDVLRYASAQAAASQTIFRELKYVDLNSFARLLFGGQVWLRMAFVGVVLVTVLPLLAWAWHKTRTAGRATQLLVWAALVTWMIVLNTYCAIYDSAIVVIAALLTTEYFYQQAGLANEPILPNQLKYLLLLLWGLPWVTQSIAGNFGLQPYSLALAALGCLQIYTMLTRVTVLPDTTNAATI